MRTTSALGRTTSREPTVTLDIRDRNDYNGHGQEYRIYRLEGDDRFFVDVNRAGTTEQHECETFAEALASVGKGSRPIS